MIHRWCGLLLVLMAFVCTTASAASASDIDTRMAHAEAIRLKDHARFVTLLDQLHHDAPQMDAKQTWRLRYNDAWESMFEGHYPASEADFRDIIARSDNEALVAKSTALLMDNLVLQARYADAYVEANYATDMLPRVADPMARFTLLSHLSQTLNFAGQQDLALKYAEMMGPATPPSETPCPALYTKVAALEGLKRLTSASPELAGAIDSCTTNGQPVFANAASLILVDMYIAERSPTKAMAVLDRIEPSIRASGYFPALVAMTKHRGQAYQQMGDLADARKWALQAVTMSHPGDFNEWLRDAYQVLYEVEKASGNADAALEYHEQYVKQEQNFRHDIDARAMAYQAARQRVLAQRMQAAKLIEENDILRLQGELDNKAIEMTRLHIALLSIVLLAVVLWVVRLRRSQLRFKRLSAHDGLTGIFIQQHFIAEMSGTLDKLKRRQTDACYITLDLDHFKVVNDTYGHTVGDAALKYAVELCKAQLRTADLFGRLGGEEFGIVLPATSREQGRAIAERVRSALHANPMPIAEGRVILAASIGVACTDTIGYDVQRLCRAADTALYRAKGEGRNRVVVDGDPEPG
jgi:diguanylate cyclase (GGDEF)-like protein